MPASYEMRMRQFLDLADQPFLQAGLPLNLARRLAQEEPLYRSDVKMLVESLAQGSKVSSKWSG